MITHGGAWVGKMAVGRSMSWNSHHTTRRLTALSRGFTRRNSAPAASFTKTRVDVYALWENWQRGATSFSAKQLARTESKRPNSIWHFKAQAPLVAARMAPLVMERQRA